MATPQITASIVISFGSLINPTTGLPAGAHLSAEIDSRPTGYNLGITNFVFGDSPVYLVYNTPNVTYTQKTTRGSLSGVGVTTVDVEDIITFAETRDATLSKPPATAVTWECLGGNTASFVVDGVNVTASDPALFAVYRATYQASPMAYRLSGVGPLGSLPSMTVLIMIDGLINP